MSFVGQVLAERYEVRRELARGGMGAVLEAHDRRLDRVVAVKASLSSEPAANLRLVDEAQVTGKLRHPSIVSVFEVGAERGQPFLVMKLVKGRTLAAIAREPLEGDALRRRLRLFLRVAEALAAAHARGVIHRDLKPQNIMVGPDGEVLVLDWGLARPVDGAAPDRPSARSRVREALARGEVLGPAGARSGDLTVEGAIVGTPAYMPAEQADGHALDARADVYGLGATLYELLGGAPPYSGSAHEVFFALFQGPPRPLRELAPSVPAPAAAIVRRAMSREARDRYADARGLADDLAAFLDDRPVSCWREPPWAAAGRLVRRHRAAFATAAVGLALVVAGGLFARHVVRGQELLATAAQESAAKRADEAARETARAEAARRLESAAQAAVQALRRGVDAVDATRRADSLATIALAHDEARAGLDAARAGLDAARAGLERDAGIAARLGDALVLARRRAQLALARALVARAPAASVERLQALAASDPALAQEATLLVARALARADRAAEARTALAAVTQDDLRPAARALELDLAGAPAAARVEAWTAAVAASRRAGWAWLGLGVARAAAGDLQVAEVDLDRAHRLDPLDPWTAVARVERLTPPCRDWVVTAGTLDLVPVLTDELPAAHKVVERAMLWRGIIDWTPTPADPRQLARDYQLPLALAAIVGMRRARTQDRPDVVLAIASRILEREPALREAIGHMAWALARLERWGEVDTLAARHLAAAPEDPDLNHALGVALWRRGRVKDALPHLELAARPSPDVARWAELARALLDAEEPARALVAARRAASLEPGADEAHSPDVELRPDLPVVPMLLGDALAASGDPARASLHHLRAYVAAVEVGAPATGLLAAGADQEALGLKDEARSIYRLAVRDPALAKEAEARLKALE